MSILTKVLIYDIINSLRYYGSAEVIIMLCDLHIHSFYSDGSHSPSEIIDLAINAGLSAIALTDHNTIDGLSEFIFAAEGKNIDIVNA